MGSLAELWRGPQALVLQMLCMLRGHQYQPYVSSVGWQSVKFCSRCQRFNPMSEWKG